MRSAREKPSTATWPPPEQQAVPALFCTEGLRVAEIAAAMDIAPGTVKTRLMHARDKLRARLEGEAT